MCQVKSVDNSVGPQVTVVTIVFNCEKYIAKCMDSVLEQDYKNLEYIIIDGKSTDGTLGVVASRDTARFKLVSEKDQGLHDAMNKGIRLAHGAYIIFMHADDRFVDRQSITRLVQGVAIEGNGKWGFGFYRYINAHGAITRSDIIHHPTYKDMLIRNVVRHQAAIVSVEVARQCLFSHRYKRALDYDHFLRVWQLVGPPLIVPYIISEFRISGVSLSSNFEMSLLDEQRARYHFRVRTRQFLIIPFDCAIFLARLCKIVLYHRPKSWILKRKVVTE
jgi:glycosyltransferase involved in cell wall biosynthesis